MKIFPREIKPVMLGHPAQEVAYQKASEGFEVAKVAGAMAAEASIFGGLEVVSVRNNIDMLQGKQHTVMAMAMSYLLMISMVINSG